MIQLSIKAGELYVPITYEGIEWHTERVGSPGSLVFTVVKDDVISFAEGAHVVLQVDGVNVFYGFVFEKSRDRNHHIQVICYDQLRYLKNKDSYVYENKTASQLVQMIADDFRLNVGHIDNTGFASSRVEDNNSMFDIILNALDDTLMSTGKMYVLYDDYGKLTLRDIETMELDMVIDEDTASNFSYTSSIDKDTYNVIKLFHEDKDTKKRRIFTAEDTNHVNQWGVLQYYASIKNPANGQLIANALINPRSGLNRKTRNLTVSGVLGDLRVRAGCKIPVILNLGDIINSNKLIVESCTHKFSENNHTMDLTLIGGNGFV